MPGPTTVYAAYGGELVELPEHVPAGDVASGRAGVEHQLMRVPGALMWLHQRHRVDEHGRCSICQDFRRMWW